MRTSPFNQDINVVPRVSGNRDSTVYVQSCMLYGSPPRLCPSSVSEGCGLVSQSRRCGRRLSPAHDIASVPVPLSTDDGTLATHLYPVGNKKLGI